MTVETIKLIVETFRESKRKKEPKKNTKKKKESSGTYLDFDDSGTAKFTKW